jgi:hypothetical protein
MDYNLGDGRGSRWAAENADLYVYKTAVLRKNSVRARFLSFRVIVTKACRNGNQRVKLKVDAQDVAAD